MCGAKNFVAGDKVPLALPGAVLPGGEDQGEQTARRGKRRHALQPKELVSPMTPKVS